MVVYDLTGITDEQYIIIMMIAILVFFLAWGIWSLWWLTVEGGYDDDTG